MLIIESEPKGSIYTELIDLASSICNQFILVKRNEIHINESANIVLQELMPYLQQVKEQNKWPGTATLGRPATIYYYSLNNESKEKLKKYADGLYSWVQPNLPEDLCFLKSDGQAWLINTAHEYMCRIDSDDENELSKLKAINGLKFRNKVKR